MATGRRSLLTKETTDRFCEAVRLGMTYKLASQYAGISDMTFYSWKRKADAGSAKHVKFLKTVKTAESHGAAKCLAVIERAAEEGSWQAAAWILERRHKYIRETVAVEAPIEDVAEMVDPNSKSGREAILEELAKLPQDLIVDALNRRTVGNAK